MQDLKELIGKKVQGARGEGVITAIDVKGNIEVDYGGKKFKHSSFSLEKGLIKLVEADSAKKEVKEENK
ncbi:MAG: hypothetical protein KH380_00970 [Coprobacillus sp.]|nr:hypothetical protein [Coprobacillus sp.]